MASEVTKRCPLLEKVRPTGRRVLGCVLLEDEASLLANLIVLEVAKTSRASLAAVVGSGRVELREASRGRPSIAAVIRPVSDTGRAGRGGDLRGDAISPSLIVGVLSVRELLLFLVPKVTPALGDDLIDFLEEGGEG